MRKLARFFQESFLPVLLVLGAILGFTYYLNIRVERFAREGEVIRIAPHSESWNSTPLETDGGTDEEMELTHSSKELPPVFSEAQKLAETGKYDEAIRLLRAAEVSGGYALDRESTVTNYQIRAGKAALAVRELSDLIASHPNDSLLLFLRGRARSSAGDRSGAEKDFREAIRQNPQQFESQFHLALLILEKHPTEAMALLNRAFDLGGNRRKARVLFNLGLVLDTLEKPDQALAAFERAVEFDPDYQRPRMSAAILVARRKHDRAGAERYVNEMLQLDKDFAPAYFVQGRIATLFHDPQGALRSYREAMKRDPTYWEVRYNLGLLYLGELDDIEKAKAFFVQLAQEFPNKAEIAFNLGRVAYQEEKYDEAIAQYELALKLRGGSYDQAELNLSLVHKRLNQPEKALKILNRLIEKQPDYAAAHLNKGLILLKMKEKAGARQAFLKAIQAKPDYSTAYFDLGLLAAEEEKWGEAESNYKRTLEINPKHWKAAINLGISYSKQQRYQEAAEIYRKAIAIEPSSARGYYNLAVIEKQLGHGNKAMELYQQALELDPDYSAARQNLITLLSEKGNSEKAVAMLRDALDHDPDDISLRYLLGLQYQKVKDPEKAKTEFQRVLSMNPNHEGARKAMSLRSP